jgi:hypothetical protein
MKYEKYAADIISNNSNMMIPWYIMAAYAYYINDDPIITDKMFDQLSMDIVVNWNFISHSHKKFLSIDMLKAGTYLGDYPLIVEGAINELPLL